MTAAPRTRACPTCGASARAEAAFCGQCYADFRPAPTPPPVEVVAVPTTPAPTAAYGVPAGDPLTQPLLDLLLPVPVAAAPVEAAAPVAEAPAPVVQATWPCLSCESPNPLSATACAVCGAGFLAAVSDAGRASLVLPVVGDLGTMSRGQRMGLAAGAVVAVLVPLALLTMLLTGSPPEVPVAPLPSTSVDAPAAQ